jgi:hypothetical protein
MKFDIDRPVREFDAAWRQIQNSMHDICRGVDPEAKGRVRAELRARIGYLLNPEAPATGTFAVWLQRQENNSEHSGKLPQRDSMTVDELSLLAKHENEIRRLVADLARLEQKPLGIDAAAEPREIRGNLKWQRDRLAELTRLAAAGAMPMTSEAHA